MPSDQLRGSLSCTSSSLTVIAGWAQGAPALLSPRPQNCSTRRRLHACPEPTGPRSCPASAHPCEHGPLRCFSAPTGTPFSSCMYTVGFHTRPRLCAAGPHLLVPLLVMPIEVLLLASTITPLLLADCCWVPLDSNVPEKPDIELRPCRHKIRQMWATMVGLRRSHTCKC